jgi:hypothetical protein
LDDRRAWIERNAERLRRSLDDPAIRAEVLEHLVDDQERKRRRRLQEIEGELANTEADWRPAIGGDG